jgi:hypothetical protein
VSPRLPFATFAGRLFIIPQGPALAFLRDLCETFAPFAGKLLPLPVLVFQGAVAIPDNRTAVRYRVKYVHICKTPLTHSTQKRWAALKSLRNYCLQLGIL